MDERENATEKRYEPEFFGDLNTEASLWILLPKLLASVVISIALFLLLFWLWFGELNNFAYSFAVFLATLQILIVVGLRFQNRPDVQAAKPLQNDWVDQTGAWWLAACAFGAFFGWVVGRLSVMSTADAVYFHLGKVFLTIILPFVTMLPNARYVNRRAAYIQIPLLVTVTALPMIVGLNSLIWLWTRFFPQ